MPFVYQEPDRNITIFIEQHHVLTLCVYEQDTMPWACNVFYVFDPSTMHLYFLSEMKTRHAQAMSINPLVSGTIADTPKSIAKIKGIQYQAHASLLTGELAQEAYALYYNAFPFARVMNAPIWCLKLRYIKMTNNVLGFAHKTVWNRAG